MEFTKMNGLGNDFIIIADEKKLPDQAAKLAIQMCDRHFGVGADGLVYILPSQQGDAMMRIINSDGSESEQCGNAIRCVAKFLYDTRRVIKTEMSVETKGAGLQKIQLFVEHDKVASVCVDMGKPQPTVIEHPIEVDGQSFRYTDVSMGNPHAIVFVDQVVDFDIQRWGPKFETHPFFPERTNTEFTTVLSRDRIDMRVWERGAGATLACGSGACATLVACVLTGKTDRKATVSLKGGDLWIEWSEEDDHVYMTGPAERVFEGKWLKNCYA